MKRRKTSTLAVASILAWALLAPSEPVAAQSGTTAFTNVAVLPMDRERVLENHTVVIQNGVIQEVAPSHRVAIPAGARIIDGQGLFLMPGLADMHVDLPSAEATSEQVADFMFLLLANNVLAIRGTEGIPHHLRIKREVGTGEVFGPTIWVGAPPLGGSNAQDTIQTVERMLANRRAGYDYQTISGDFPPEVWEAMAEEAHSRGYTFGGTIPRSIGLRGALSTGISSPRAYSKAVS